MKKTKKKLLLTAVTTMIACSLSAGLVMTAFADEATSGHEFDGRNGDVVFEDFDRANLEGVVSTTTAELTDLGEAPYLHVAYDAMPEETPAGARNGWIYKQGSGDLAGVQTNGAIRITMRAPEGDVELSDLCFAVRGIDDEAKVLVKNFSELQNGAMEEYPALSTTWATYEISFSNSYDETDVYPTATEENVTNTNVMGFHIFPVAEKAGTLDILSVEYHKGGNYQALNNFTGGADVTATAKAVNEATWWAGADNGEIVKRMPTLTNGGDLLVVKEAAVGDYAYAIIETEGDAAHLKVATTTDGTTFGEAAAYDGYSVALTGAEKGFKFTYDGEESVSIKRIYLTNLEAIVPDTATPVINAKTAEYLDDFSAAQSGFSGDYDAMVAATESAGATDMYFRLSYSNGDKVNIANGALVFDEMPEGYTQLKFNSKTLHTQKYVVLKMKLEGEGANLDKFRFALIGENDATTDVVWAPNFKSGVEYGSKLLEASNPYKDGDWYYVVVDIDESGFAHYESGYSGMDMYYGGEGKLYIDEIFFADKVNVPDIEKDIELDAKVEAEATTDYAYAYMYIPNDGTGKTISFDITPAAEGFDPSTLRFGFEGVDGTFWGAENADGSLITVDGKKLNELTYTAGTATKVVIDLEKSGIIGAFGHVHVHRDNIGAFTLDNVVLHTAISPFDAKDLDAENAVTATDITFTAESEGYQYAGAIENFASNVYATLEFKFTPGAGCTGPNGIRLQFGAQGVLWTDDNPEGALITTDGNRVDEYIAAYLAEHEDYSGEAIPIAIDLAASGIAGAINKIDIHTAGTSTGSFTITDIKLTPYVDYLGEYYTEALDMLPLYLDNVKPTVSITTATTAKVGDEITVAYTASDNKTEAADLTVEVTVTKGGNSVALSDNKFTAEEGVYTVTVKVTDVAGNEATDVKQITVTKKAGGTQSSTGSKKDDGKGLSGGAIAGIVIGCVAGVGLIAGAVWFLLRRKKKNG